jgi:hypothetical protein
MKFRIILVLLIFMILSVPGCNQSTEPGNRTGAVCKDGTRSNSTGQGTCSHHGGVDHWLY